ncbi:hypothetical protein [Ideonella sp. BN130291]|uniref:hypothetical protein n=1 Tax=Ideonella sp. BN130291 TaxID=3112940 RepID=UPI002E259964|nr:hypothetical protein [Ideonella sp. BN130291]
MMAQRQSPQRVPTLTEVVQPAPTEVPASSVQVRAEALPFAEQPPLIDEGEVTRRVLVDVQRQVDLMLEYRLRDALNPLLARLSDALIHELRDELASTLRDVVARAVAQEIERHRGR